MTKIDILHFDFNPCQSLPLKGLSSFKTTQHGDLKQTEVDRLDESGRMWMNVVLILIDADENG